MLRTEVTTGCLNRETKYIGRSTTSAMLELQLTMRCPLRPEGYEYMAPYLAD